MIAAPLSAIELLTGEKLPGARVIAFGEKTATLIHEGKIRIVAVDEVPLDVLGRAYLELEERRTRLASYHAAAAGRNERAEARVTKEELAAADKAFAEHQAAQHAALLVGDGTNAFDALKNAFPHHSGDAALVVLVDKYKRVVDRIEDQASLAAAIVSIRTMLDDDLRSLDLDRYFATNANLSGDTRLSTRPRYKSAAQQRGEAQKKIWLKNHLTPYLRRLEAAQG